MINKTQVKVLIKLLKDKAIDERPPLKQVFEQGGYLWATNGYMTVEIGEVMDKLKGKRITLEALQAWNATHTKKTDQIGGDDFEDNPYNQPDMTFLLHDKYEAPTESPMFDINLLKLGCDYLGITGVSLEADNGRRLSYCYRLKPVNENEMDILTKAMDSKVYIMGLKK